MVRSDPLYHIWLSFRLGYASEEFLKLLEHFDDVFEIYRADEEALKCVSGLSEAAVDGLCDKSLESARRCMYTCARYNIKISIDNLYFNNYCDKMFTHPLKEEFI